MDPNACLERFLDALEENDYREAFEAHRDLQQWMAKGGFSPTWGDWEGAKEAYDGFKTLPRYTSIGNYPLVYFNDSDTFCHCCAVPEGFEEWDATVYWEGSAIACDLCGEMIESAYGMPEQAES